MKKTDKIVINLMEPFPHLSRAPIKEAVIEIRGRTSVQWEEAHILSVLKPQLPEYPEHRPMRGFVGQIQFAAGQTPKAMAEDLGWHGLQFISADKKEIAKFQLDLFSFSRLEPYEDWEKFSNEALRLWQIHAKLSKLSVIERVGVRFINRFPLPHDQQMVKVSDYFNAYADDLPELKLTLAGFLHHETMVVPGHPYAMNVIKTVQAADAPESESAFILDIDVFTQFPDPVEGSIETLRGFLADMHWLKNKAFFGIITNKLKESLKE